MNYFLHGVTLAFAWFAGVNAATSLIVAMAARRDWRVASPAFWLALRLLPGLAAALFVVAVFVPAYAAYEPRDTGEGFDATLTTLAAAAIALIGVAAVRAVAAWRRAHGRSRRWMAGARRLASTAAGIPVFAVDSATPVMALVGIWSPRLLVTRGLVSALTPEEFDASVAHEVGHSRAWDNLKRLAMCATPDVLPGSLARTLERRWAAAAEHAADGHAGSRGPSARCALASALVKVARLMPAEPQPAEPISTLVGGGDIAARVRRLLDDPAPLARTGTARPVLSLLGAAAAAGFYAYAPLLQAVHHATEVLVNTLP